MGWRKWTILDGDLARCSAAQGPIICEPMGANRPPSKGVECRLGSSIIKTASPIICEPGLEVCFDAAASSLAVRQRIRAAGWAVSVTGTGSLLRACGVRLCSDRCAWDAGRRFLSCGG